MDNYWVKAVPNLGDKSTDKGINSAILRYKGAPVAEPKARNVKSVMPMLETDLHPLERMPVVRTSPLPVNRTLTNINGPYV